MSRGRAIVAAALLSLMAAAAAHAFTTGVASGVSGTAGAGCVGTPTGQIDFSNACNGVYTMIMR